MKKTAKTIRILLADDHALVRNGIRALLKKDRAWKVVGEASNGLEALAKADKLRPDVVILDLAMPKLDGLQTARQMCAAMPAIKILILTMHESDQMVRRVFEAGAHGYVLKSDLAAQLIKGVKEVSRGRQYLTPKVSEILLNGSPEPDDGGANGTSGPSPAFARLTPRELEVIRLLADGKGNKEIAAALQMAVRTVETHRANIMSKLGLHSATALVRYAVREGIC